MKRIICVAFESNVTYRNVAKVLFTEMCEYVAYNGDRLCPSSSVLFTENPDPASAAIWDGPTPHSLPPPQKKAFQIKIPLEMEKDL